MNAPASARRISTAVELAFGCMFGLQPALAHTLAVMFDGQEVKAMRTQIHRLRAALSEEAVDTGPDGYCLTEVGRDECNQAIIDFKQWGVSSERAA